MGELHTDDGSPRPGWVGAVVAVLAVLSLLAAGCKSSTSSGGTTGGVSDNAASTDEGTPTDGGSLVVGVPYDTNGWNPTYDQWSGVDEVVGSSVLEPLLALDDQGQAQPFLLTAWEPNATLDSWTLHLRDGVQFQDGEPFDAAAVKQNIEALPDAPLSGVAFKGLIKGATVIDEHTVRVDVAQPWGAFPTSFLTGQSAAMMAPAMFSAPDHGQSHPVGTGPFTFVSWSPGNAFVAKKNESYWQAGKPHLDQVTFKVIPDQNSLASALQTGDANLILLDDPAAADRLASSYHVIKDWQLDPSMILTSTLPTTNGQANPLTNQHARMALAYGTDRDALAAAVGVGVLIPSSPFPSNSPWGLPDDQTGYPTYDPQKAKDEVEAYKRDTGADTLRFTVSGQAGSEFSRVLQLLQAQWKDVGISVSIEQVETAALITQVVTGHYQAAMFNLYTFQDPDQYNYMWSANTAKGEGTISINMTQFTTPQLEADLVQGRQSTSFDDRKAAYDDAAKQINGAAVNIWLYYVPHSMVADKEVKGLQQAAAQHFANFQPKTWWGDVWRSS